MMVHGTMKVLIGNSQLKPIKAISLKAFISMDLYCTDKRNGTENMSLTICIMYCTMYLSLYNGNLSCLTSNSDP